MRFVSSGLDKKINVVNTITGDCEKTFENSFMVNNVMLGPEECTVVAACSDRKLRLFHTGLHTDTSCRALVSENSSITSVSMSSDRQLALLSLCSEDPRSNPLRLWDLGSEQLQTEYKGHVQGKYVIRYVTSCCVHRQYRGGLVVGLLSEVSEIYLSRVAVRITQFTSGIAPREFCWRP